MEDEMGWRPIDAAPKDGSEILVYRDGEFGVAVFRHPFVDTAEQGEWLSVTMAGPNGRRAYERLEARFPQDVVHSGTPTHWMPLPAPPHTSEGSNGR